MHKRKGYYIPKHIIYLTNVSIRILPILWEWARTNTLGNSVSFLWQSKILLCIKIIHHRNKLSPNRAPNAYSPCTQSWGKHFKFTYFLTNGGTVYYLRHILESFWTEILEMVNKVILMLFINSIDILSIYLFMYYFMDFST